MRLVSWNVNGLRAIFKKGFQEFVEAHQFDIVCIQESKIHHEILDSQFHLKDYTLYSSCAQKKGYSGVAVYSKLAPLRQELLGEQEFDEEGRVLGLDFDNFYLINAYFPNSQDQGRRIEYKVRFLKKIEQMCLQKRLEGKNVIITGDFNIAHKPIDLAHPKQNEHSAGYLPQEREWMEHFVSLGYVDTFRIFNQEAHQYTWWSYFSKARERNIGWRIDYFHVDEKFPYKIQKAQILQEVLGSDHAPVTLEFS